MKTSSENDPVTPPKGGRNVAATISATATSNSMNHISMRRLVKNVSSRSGLGGNASDCSGSVTTRTNSLASSSRRGPTASASKREGLTSLSQPIAPFHISEVVLGERLESQSTCEVHEIKAIRQNHKEEMPMDQHARDCMTDQATNRRSSKGKFVLKFIRRECMDSQHIFEKAASALENEATIMKGFCHPNIARLRGISIAGTEAYYLDGRHDSFFLIVERIEETLEQRIGRWRSQDRLYRWRTLHGLIRRKQTEHAFLMERLRVGFDISDGLQYIHSHGISHRNIHGKSIGFNSSGEVQIIDFCKACRQRHASSSSIGSNLLPSPEDTVSRPSLTDWDESGESIYSSSKSLRVTETLVESGPQQDILAFSGILCEILTMRSSGPSMNHRQGKAYIKAFCSLAGLIPRRLLGMIQRGLSDIADCRPNINELRECLSDVLLNMNKEKINNAAVAACGNPNLPSSRSTRRPTQLSFGIDSEELNIVYEASDKFGDNDQSDFDTHTGTELTQSVGTSLTGKNEQGKTTA